jgi:hypothetical protein
MRSRVARLSVVLAAVVIIAIGLGTLLGLLLGTVQYAIPEAVPVIGGVSGDLALNTPARVFLRIAVITVALSVLIGILNLLYTHVRRIVRANTFSARLSSLALLASFVAAYAYYVIDPEVSRFLLQEVQIPIESALAGLLFFALVYGGSRILKDRVTPARLLFVITTLVILAGALPFPQLALFRDLTDWLLNVPVNAGGRGILLGIALATIVAGLRILIGQDRTYGG